MMFDEWWEKEPVSEFSGVDATHVRRAWEAATLTECERICAAIEAEDDHCSGGDYMLDSDDCISVARGTWKRPSYAGT